MTIESSEIFGVHSECHKPTGVEESCVLNFYNDQEENLVTTSVNILTVYRIRKHVNIEGDEKKSFELVEEFELWGTICSICKVRFSGSLRDSILLSFEEAKCSIVEYEPDTESLQNVSMHYFQEENLKHGFRKMNALPYARVDPAQRCASVLVYGNHFAILPLRRSGQSIIKSNNGGMSSFEMSRKNHSVSSFMINIEDLPRKIARVIDFKFLDGYNDPTLVVLYEALPTWTGRISDRQDTCGILALSVNLIDHSHPVIWQMSALPYDCQFCEAVPKPLGGLLVMAANSIIYLDQSVPPFGVSVNNLTNGSTQFALREQPSEPISLVNAKSTFIKDNTVCLSLENGDVYFLILQKDPLNNVRQFILTKSASSVIPTTLSVLSDNLIFLGSRLGNSLLLQYTVSEESTSNGEAASLDGNKPAPHSVSQPPEAKRKRINTAAEWEGVVKPNQAVLDAEEEELTSIEGYYGNEIHDVDFVEHYQLKTMDSMNNIGPCANAELIHSSNINEQYDDIRNDARDRNLDLMVLTGKGKSGAITLLQKSIRPNIVTSFPFPTNYNDMWTLNDNKSEFNSLLVITKKDQTMIFKTGAQIEELKREDCGLSTTAKTIFCCTMSNGLYIIQVLPRAVILVQQQTQEKLQHMPMDLDGMIIQASSSDPFVAILTSKGVMVNLKLSLDQEGKPLLQAVKTPEQFPEIPEKKITHVTMMTDKGAKFKLKMGRKQLRDEENSRNLERNPFPSESNFRSTAIESSNNILTAEEEDELLYGVETQDSVFDGPDMTNATNDQELYKDTEADSRSWMAITRQSGNIEFYTLPDCELRFKDRNFANAPRLVESSRFEGGESRRGDVPIIQEINLFHLGPRQIPHLVAIISDQLLIYQYRPCKIKYETKKPMLGGRFIKQRPTELLRTLSGTQEEGKKSKNNKMIRHFDDINGYSGFVLTGPYPYWCIAGKSGRLRLHSQWQDGMINCFTQFHNENCNNGFLYFQQQTKTLSGYVKKIDANIGAALISIFSKI